MTPILVDEAGVRPVADPADIRSRVGQGAFLWLDLVGADTSLCPAWLSELGLEGRMSHGRCGSDRRDGCSSGDGG
jgi:hypothetical protein